MKAFPKEKESLWLIVVSPAIWAAHFMLCYLTASIFCAKLVGSDGSLQVVRLLILIYTVFALIGISLNGWGGYRRHRFGNSSPPHDHDSPADRHRFLGFATFLLAALSAAATLYAALVAVFIKDCY